MFKILGILFGFIACVSIGLLKASEIKGRRIILLDFKEMILHISTEMSYFKEPLPQIFQRIASTDNRESCIFLRSCLSSYSQKNLDISQIWKTSIDDVYEKTPLLREDIVMMKKCGDFLGQSDFKGQQDHFSLLNAQLDRQLKEAEHAIGTKGKMYGKMGVSVGLIMVIVLI